MTVTLSLLNRPLLIEFGVLDTRLEVLPIPGNVTMLWTELVRITRTTTWLILQVSFVRGGILQENVLRRNLNRLRVCLPANLSILNTPLRTLLRRTWIELLLSLALPNMTLHVPVWIVFGLSLTPL